MKSLFLKVYTCDEKAFTLVETLIAISVLLIAVVGPLSVISESVITANIAKDQVTAQYLAQEGVEIVRLIRDTNILNGNSWLGSSGTNSNAGFANCVSTNPASPVYCYMAPNGYSAVILPCPTPTDSSSCVNLNLFDRVNSGGVRTYAYAPASNIATNWSATTFKRSVSVVEIVPDQEAEVSSVVTWQTGAYSRTVTVKERLFKWN